MDYKYIEQLLERYWNCETSLEEEQILRSFFRQKEVPAHLLRYKQLFAYQDVEKEKGLGDDFDTRILTRIERPVVKAQRRRTWWYGESQSQNKQGGQQDTRHNRNPVQKDRHRCMRLYRKSHL